jgi:hypothetical protein
MLEDLRAILEGTGVAATFFCTHESPGVRGLLGLPGVEAALHPNFLVPRLPQVVLSELLGLFPGARGIRNHVLFYHSRLLPLLHRAGLTYFSNDIEFLEPGLAPRDDWSGMLRLPIYFEDDVHLVHFDGAAEIFDPAVLRLEEPGLKVRSFHPVHVFLNTRDLVAYQEVKARLRDPTVAASARVPGPGTRTLLLALLERLVRLRVRTATLGEVATSFRRDHPVRSRYRDFLARSDAAAASAIQPDDGTRATHA